MVPMGDAAGALRGVRCWTPGRLNLDVANGQSTSGNGSSIGWSSTSARDDAERVTKADLIGWKDALLASGKGAKTVKNSCALQFGETPPCA
jgi:hypothetical protein